MIFKRLTKEGRSAVVVCKALGVKQCMPGYRDLDQLLQAMSSACCFQLVKHLCAMH